MLDGALARYSGAADRIGLLEEQSFLWAECQRGEEALRSADAAAGLGSNSVRTHYLRGRALALLGRLEEAALPRLREILAEKRLADEGKADQWLDRRHRVAVALGYAGPQAIPLLRELLGDRHPWRLDE